MSLNLRIFLAYFLIVVMASIVFLNMFMSELKPGMRQSSEDSLVDTANLLAEMVAPEFIVSPSNLPNFVAAIDRFLRRKYKADIFTVNKMSSAIRIYITDEKGIVRYDSSGADIGADYSQWNDVYLTLQGKYGVRSTKSDPDNEFSTVMHIAAPIKEGSNIVGVLTVAKPNFTVQPFIDMAYKKIVERGVLLIIISLIVALSISYLLTRSIRKLVQYADDISRGKKAVIPKVDESELSNLATSIDNMRVELEGRDYVEKYVYALTHELKSPIAAIKGASEILTPQMPPEDLQRFIGNIQVETHRIDEMINRLLSLVTVEKQDTLDKIEKVDLVQVLAQVSGTKQTQLSKLAIELTVKTPNDVCVNGDEFLLSQAIDNLLQNAIDFSHQGSTITVMIKVTDCVELSIQDQGSGIPGFAIDKIFERFYSLARPSSHKKSSGLGLCFVKQIAQLHRGDILIVNNEEKGVKASLLFPS
ncbi:MAG: two-component system sensor histidine kinase CreC [Litorilituus sp.]|jgi:two-component system sensor histidine kinase CreC|nr:two-component system sensor histidine kinase CreC [Litorilituus sp.]